MTRNATVHGKRQNGRTHNVHWINFLSTNSLFPRQILHYIFISSHFSNVFPFQKISIKIIDWRRKSTYEI